MKNKILVAITLMIICAFAVNTFAVGQNSKAQKENHVQQQTQTVNQGEDSQIQVPNNKQVQNEDMIMNQVQNQNQENNTSTVGQQNQEQKQEQQGQVNAEQHRSTVANFVQTLLKTVSSTEDEIGQQVRVIAQQQNDSDATTTEAIEKIQSRNKIQTFLFGSDYKNLGALRSEIVQTRNRINQLNRVIQNATETTVIQTQIQALEQEQTKIENFITAQESRFSLFGWLVKMFNK
jgi:hypothetical protein